MDLLTDFLLDPRAIETKSMEIIEGFLGESSWREPEKRVVKRVIHTTGDPEFAKIIAIHPNAVEAGINAIRGGANVITDVEMVRSGVSKKNLAKAGGAASCFLNEPQVAAKAREWGTTRTMAALRLHKEDICGSIIAIGNAPTALMETIRLVQEEGKRPALIVGCPVGFVGAAESKEVLAQQQIPFITVKGNKGGSTIAAAIVNALIYLSVQRDF
ncbi:MAG TPA: precorrin-8X methylmutase [Desulfobacteria bacterium]|nr:precorrin-8X methylmutase [Desulfobacteria bacterium]